MQIAICILYERKMFRHINSEFPPSSIQYSPLFISLLHWSQRFPSMSFPLSPIISTCTRFECSSRSICQETCVCVWEKWRTLFQLHSDSLKWKSLFLCRFNLDKRFEYKCSWKIFSIALIFLSVILTALLAYFASKCCTFLSFHFEAS